MAHTPTDDAAVIRNLKAEVAHLTGKLDQAQKEDDRRKQSVNRIRVVVDEAIGLTDRMKLLLTGSDTRTSKRKAELQSLNAYFRDCKRHFDTVLAGFPVADKAERPEINADTWNNTG